MKKYATILVALCAIASIATVVIVFETLQKNPQPEVGAQVPKVTIPKKTTTPPLSFTWIFEKAPSLNPDGINQTNVVLEVKYVDGTVVRKNIDTVDGSCNEVDKADANITASSTQIQCYAAGFGQWFKVTKGKTGYEVKRKNFEEATPEQTPTKYEYEVLTEFPF